MAETRNPGAGGAGARECVLLAGTNYPDPTEARLALQVRRLTERYNVPAVRARTVADLVFAEVSR